MTDMREWFRFGEFLTTGELTAADVRDVVARGRALREECRRVPVLQLVEILEHASRLLADPDHPVHREAMDRLPDIVGFSRPMVQAGLGTLADIMSREGLVRRLTADLGSPHLLDEFQWQESFRGYVRAEPRGLVGHVAAGNVFVGAVDSLVQGIVTKNVNLLKMAGVDPLFPLLFARAVAEADPEGLVTRTFALLPFRGGNEEVEAVLKEACDALVVYGGEDAVKAYRSGLGLHTRIVEYGPKYSCVVLDGAELERRGVGEVARLVARDFTMWDQSACSSPHTVFVRGGDAEEFARALGRALEGWLEEFPHGRIPLQEQVEILRARELARVEQALGEGELLIPAPDRQDWTVVYEESPTFRVSCHHRTAYVKPVASLDAVIAILQPYGQFLQTVAVVADVPTTFEFSERLVAAGADRVVDAGEMAVRRHGTPHDGTRGTAELVRWVSLSRSRPFLDAFDYHPDAFRDRTTLSRLNRLLDYVRERSPFYRGRLPDRPLQSLEELRQIPVLGQDEFKSKLPPYGEGLLTGPLRHGYAFSSGGTTGAPKFVYRTIEETLANARALAKGLSLSIFTADDVVANLLFAGNLWASFVSYNQALERCGCQILPIAGNIDMDSMIAYVKAFRPTGAISIPSVILSLAERVEKDGLDLRIPKIVTGGEHLFPEARDYIARVLGTTQFASTGYTTNDTGAIGYQCEAVAGGVHHVHEDVHYLELVDPQTGEPAEEGKVVVTNLQRFLMPTIRYDVGDMGRWVEGPCPCGRRTRRMELLGRSDDVLIIGGGNVHLEGVARAIAQVEGLSYHFRMLARIVDRKDLFVLEVEDDGTHDEAGRSVLAARLAKTLHHEQPVFDAFLRSGSIQPPEVRVLAPGTLPRNPRTGKIRQVVEERT